MSHAWFDRGSATADRGPSGGRLLRTAMSSARGRPSGTGQRGAIRRDGPGIRAAAHVDRRVPEAAGPLRINRRPRAPQALGIIRGGTAETAQATDFQMT